MTINMSKGDAPVKMTKTPVITARVSWASNTDYDLHALVLRTDGKVEHVAMFGARGVSAASQTVDGSVVHKGDVGRTGLGNMAEETMEFRLNDTIRAIVPVAYSAQSNGTGSFRQYQVSLDLDNGAGETVHVGSIDASDNKRVYSCAIGIIENTPSGVVVHPLEEYSSPNSENRPDVDVHRGSVRVRMDKGPRNLYK